MRKRIKVFEGGNAVLVDLDDTSGITDSFTGPNGPLQQIDEVEVNAKNLEKHMKITKKEDIERLSR